MWEWFVEALHLVLAIGAFIECWLLLRKYLKHRKETKSAQATPGRLGPNVLGSSYALACAVLWSLSYVSLRAVQTRVPLYEMNLILLGVGFLFLLLWWWIIEIREPAGADPAARVNWQSASSWIVVVANVASFWLFIESLQFISASQTIALQKLNPLFVAFLTWAWLRRRPAGSTWFAITIAVLGTTLIMTNIGEPFQFDTPRHIDGSLIAVAAGACFAVFGVGLEHVHKTVTTPAKRVGFMTTVFLFSFFLLSTFGYFQSGMPNIQRGDLVVLIANALRIAVVYALYQAAIGRIGALRASVIVALEVPMTMVWEWIFFHEQPRMSLILGSIAIIAAGLAITLDRRDNTLFRVPQDRAGPGSGNEPGTPR